jgi:tetratricopeptide (TPR) repeat protein
VDAAIPGRRSANEDISFLLRSILVAVFLLLSPTFIFCDDAQAPVVHPELATADQLYRAGKFVEAEASYRALLNNDSKFVPAQVGLVRAMLRQQKIDEALDAVTLALATQPNSAALLAAKGDVQFRRAEMSDAESAYLKAKKLDPTVVRSYLGLARVYEAYSMYRIAYGELEMAHQIAPDDIEVQRAWLATLPRKERLASLEAYLAGAHPDDEQETKRMSEYLAFLKATADQPVHACRLVSKVAQTETKLEAMYSKDGWTTRGIGLSVKLNDRTAHLLLDTGAGGIWVTRKVAEKAQLKRVSAVHYGGIGDKGLQSGYAAVADHIRIGELEFQDCLVSVSDQLSLADTDGLVGADVFGAYLVDIDLPGGLLKLSPLPKRPEDAVAPKSLNSEGDDHSDDHGDEQANAEQKKESTAEPPSRQQISPAPTSQTPPSQTPRRMPRDRYVAPEMVNWTKVFRFGHAILVPTSVNDSKAMLFGLDTGAFSNILSLRAGRQTGKVVSDYRDRVDGLNGEVKKVYAADKATLSFGHFRQSNWGMVTLDLSAVSRQTGTEVSGFLGFAMLRQLDLKLDYRDGLVDFVYDPKRAPPTR